MYTGPGFIIEARLAHMVVIIFISMTFASAMPILYLITAIHLIITYWIDKFLILRFYRETIGYTVNLSRRTLEYVPYAIFLHIFFGYMCFSDPHLLRTSTDGLKGLDNLKSEDVHPWL